MIKDTFFSMPRFVNLCRKDMVENWRSNVLRIVLMYGVMALIMIWNGYGEMLISLEAHSLLKKETDCLKVY